jgi:hypothetical protein
MSENPSRNSTSGGLKTARMHLPCSRCSYDLFGCPIVGRFYGPFAITCPECGLRNRLKFWHGFTGEMADPVIVRTWLEPTRLNAPTGEQVAFVIFLIIGLFFILTIASAFVYAVLSEEI